MQHAVAAMLAAMLMTSSQASSLRFRSEEGRERPVQHMKDTYPQYFAASGLDHPFNFLNEFGGVDGFDVMLTKEVCAAAGRRCRSVMTPAAKCVYTDRNNATGIPMQDMDYAGEALLGGGVAGCPGYQATTDFGVMFDHSLPYRLPAVRYLVAKGNPRGVDVSGGDLTNLKIAHVSGEASNRQCLRRNKKEYDPLKLVIAEDILEGIMLVQSGEADVLMTGKAAPGLDHLADVDCQGDVAVLMTKDSPVRSWWNRGFRKLYRSGAYHKLCKYAEDKFGAPIRCLPKPEEASPELLKQLDLDDEEADLERKDKLWVFMASGRSEAYSYLDKSGELQGFTKDVIVEVCRRAGRRCHMAVVNNDECIFRVNRTYFPGRGLLSGWFDACTGYYDTEERKNAYDFTAPYMKNFVRLQVAPGNPKKIDPKAEDMSALTIVHKTNAESNSYCLHRLGHKTGKIIEVETRAEAVELITSGKADIYFTTRLSMAVELEALPGILHCEPGGTCMALPKGSRMPQWWDPAMKAWLASGQYGPWCKERSKHYNFEFPCLDDSEF